MNKSKRKFNRKRSLRRSKKRSLRRSLKKSKKKSIRKSRRSVRGGGNLFSKSIFSCSDETGPTNKELVVELFNFIDNVYKDKIKNLKMIGPLGNCYNISFDTQNDKYHFSITTKIGNEDAIINIKNKLTDKVIGNNVITDNVMLFLENTKYLE